MKREKWNERYAARELVWSAGPNARFASEVADLTPGTALDVGCGEGRNALWLAEQGWRATGVDFSTAAIAKAKRIAERRELDVRWIVIDVAQDPLPHGHFDLVAVLYLHTDLAERGLWLPKIVDAVAPGGTFLYIGHDPANIARGVGGPQDASLLPAIEDVCLALADFRIELAATVERPVAQDPGHGASEGVAQDALIRAVRRATSPG